MVISLPQHHSFSDSLRDKVFKEPGRFLPEWEISVPRKHDLAWSIMLSYLMSTNYRDPNDFGRRLIALTGSTKNAKFVNKSIRRLNPFRNKCSCFYDENLKTVMNRFREKLHWKKSSSVSEKLAHASDSLNCPILLIREYKKTENYQIFKKSVENMDSLIVLIESSIDDLDNPLTPVTVYNMLIDNDLGSRMKTAALKFYLNETCIPNTIIKVLTRIVAKENNFIKAVLNSKCKKFILDVYNFPYVVSKLSEAGYEMDPRAIDSEGFCGLYYALTLKNPEILYKLYYFSANNCCQAEVSFRNPDPNIVSNLQNIEELLLDNLSKLKDSKDNQQYSDMKAKVDELLKLNRFLIEINKKILEIKNRLNYYESTLDNVFETCKRRDLVVSILDTYGKYFTYQDDPSLLTLDSYVFNKVYYGSVDIMTTIMFFDNITFLKERLKLENDKAFSEIESSFLFFTAYNIAFQKPKLIDLIQSATSFSLKEIYIFPLIKRFDNLKKLNSFGKILRDITVSKDNVVNFIPESEIYSTLYQYPIIKDILEICRLETYIKISKNIRIMDTKSVLVIERILQVLGECIAPEKKDDFSFKRFLSLCLPKEISQLLRRLRNDLSHLKGHAFPSKFEIEKNVSLFRSILSEINEIENYFQPVYRIILLSFIVYLRDQFLIALQEIKYSGYLSCHSVEKLLLLNLDAAISVVLSPVLKVVKRSCHNFLKMALINLEDEIKKEYLSSDIDIKDLKNRIAYLLWPLKWLLELLKRYYNMDSVAGLLNTLTDLKSDDIDSFNILKDKVDVFMKECYDLLPKFNVVRKRNRTHEFKTAKYIEYFMKILKGFVYLSNEEKDDIRKEIPAEIKKQVRMKNELVQSIEEGFTLNIDVNSEYFELTIFLSSTKIKYLKDMYESKDSYALTILKTMDPISELEEIFKNNSADKKKYDKLCQTMQFSDKTKRKLGKLVAGQRKKLPANNLKNLLNRIQLLRTITIDDDEEIQNLWIKIKREQSRQLINEKIVRRYLKDRQFQAAIEMLLFDCMILFEGVKLSENLWIKSSKLFQGINMRNIISHGNPLVESLCMSIDPQELPSEIVKNILLLIRGEDAITAILELYECHNDYTKVLEIINCDEEVVYCDLRRRINNCDEWKNYVLLLPDTHRKNVT